MPHIENEGIRIVYDVIGDGPPLVLLHGATLDGSVWSRAGYVDDLKTDYRLVIVDLRGHGRSDKPYDPESYRMDAMASDIVAVADAEGADRFGIWGWSQGTIVAWAITRLATERVAAFIGTGDPTPRPWSVEEWAGFDRALLEPLRVDGMAGFLRSVEHNESDLIEMRDVMLRADPDVVLALFAKELLTTDGFDPEADFPVPTLLIVGEHEDVDRDAERIASIIRNGRSLRLPGVGHPGAFSRSDLVLPTAREFLGSWLT
jgi:pimeloyl-ACP methyl ester carboxylesterase